MRSYLDFEKPVAEIEAKLEELRALDAGDSAAAIGEEVARLEIKAAQTLRKWPATPTGPIASTMWRP
jgi:acetyl-CoA carboxylase carboxyl transferase subunit alpha